MGYHVAIVRTGTNSGITPAEVESLGQRFGCALVRNDVGDVTQASCGIDSEELVLFFDDGELWTKNPNEHVISRMIEIANVFGAGARVRGDEGETYKTPLRSYVHADDAHCKYDTPHFYWKDAISLAPPIIGGTLLLFAVARILLKYFGWL